MQNKTGKENNVQLLHSGGVLRKQHCSPVSREAGETQDRAALAGAREQCDVARCRDTAVGGHRASIQDSDVTAAYENESVPGRVTGLSIWQENQSGELHRRQHSLLFVGFKCSYTWKAAGCENSHHRSQGACRAVRLTPSTKAQCSY